LARSARRLHVFKPDVVTTYLVAGGVFCVILAVDGSLIFGRDVMFLKRLQRRKNGKKHAY
jgi:hypothetical protein